MSPCNLALGLYSRSQAVVCFRIPSILRKGLVGPRRKVSVHALPPAVVNAMLRFEGLRATELGLVSGRHES